jgi:hypothetical protein
MMYTVDMMNAAQITFPPSPATVLTQTLMYVSTGWIIRSLLHSVYKVTSPSLFVILHWSIVNHFN